MNTPDSTPTPAPATEDELLLLERIQSCAFPDRQGQPRKLQLLRERVAAEVERVHAVLIEELGISKLALELSSPWEKAIVSDAKAKDAEIADLREKLRVAEGRVAIENSAREAAVEWRKKFASECQQLADIIIGGENVPAPFSEVKSAAEELRKKKARLDWVLNKFFHFGTSHRSAGMSTARLAVDVLLHEYSLHGAEAAIDAAMQQEAKS